MKKIFIISVFVAVSHLGIAQTTKKTTEENKPKSNLEIFSDKSGRMFKKEYLPLGSLKGSEFEVLKITDLSTNEMHDGLRIHSPASATGVSTSTTAYLDGDEIAALMKAVDYFINNISKTAAPDNSVEYIFDSRSGMRLGIFNTAGMWGNKKKWSVVLSADKIYSSASSYLSVDDLTKIKEILVQANSKL